MQNVGNESGKSKTSAPWFKCFPKDWREGTRQLSPEHRGIYMDCLCLIYERDAPLPADDKWMSHALHISIRAWRAAVAALAKHGKLIPLQDGWTNERADEERLKRRSTADQNAIIAQSREDQKREKSKKGNENNETPPQSVPRNEHHAGRASQSLESRGREDKPIPSDGGERVQLEKGRLTLFNGLRQYWLDEFGGDEKRLDLALTQAAGYVQPNSFRPLEAQVSAQLARVCAEKRDRDARYASASAAKAKPEGKPYVPCPAPLPRDEAAEDRAMRARVKAQIEAACAGVSA